MFSMEEAQSSWTEEQKQIFKECVEPVLKPGVSHDELMKAYDKCSEHYDEVSS